MGLVAIGGFLAVFYGLERSAALVRKMRSKRLRGEAEYPITANDPMGRTVI